MTRFVAFAVLATAVQVAAQDHYVPLGFANAGGPPTASFPVMRAKDQNNDGIVQNNELSAFLRTCFHTSGGTCFMTDGQVVVENGEPVFYLTDSEQGRVIRGVDANHNGELEGTEVTEFFYFGIRTTAVNLLAPDTVGVYRDPATNQTRVYVGLDNTAASTLGYTAGIHRLVDLNGDGDAKDPGEQTLFASTGMGMTVQGNTGPIVVNVSFVRLIRVLPGGKIVAWAQGRAVNPTTPTIQPDQNVFYGFTDTNGVATAEVWLNTSTLNDIPRHPDWANGTYPVWDAYQSATVPPTQNCFSRFLAVVPSGPGGLPVYYIGSSYGVTDPTDLNVNGQHVGGLIYRVVDFNQNQSIDAGELSLYCNISGTAYNGVNPVTFANLLNQNPISQIAKRWWGMSSTNDGSVHFSFDAGTTNTGIVSMRDDNFDGVIDNNEIRMVWVDSGHPFPLNSTTGGFYDDFFSLADGTMPGPFPAGVTVAGDGCTAPARGMKPVMDVWNGGPTVGNAAFQIGTIRTLPFTPSFMLADFFQSPVPVPLAVFGGAPGCLGYLQSPTTLGLAFGDTSGRARMPLPIPNDPAMVGVTVLFQGVMYDPTSTQALPYYTSNVLSVSIQ
jgi:hypothetical protein